ncbi:MAG: penicillin-binding protein 2 [Kiritimatiellae bacterium]|nr:penicillin-binding protein 2 [Kiritimatiellia bacterium]
MNRDEQPVVSGLSCLVLAAVFAAGLLHLGVRLKEVQVDDSADYSYANARQSVRRVQTAGVRGRILDRKGRVLAANRRSVSITCQPTAFQKRTWEATAEAIEQAVSNVAAAIGRPSPLSAKAVRRHIRQSLAMPLFVWRDIGERELAVFSEREREFPGFAVEESVERHYPEGALAAHVIGYVGRDRGEAEAGDEKFNFVTPELRGRSGLEAYYDSFMRGVSGERKLLVDARGFAIRRWTVVESQRGPDLQLTLDVAIQEEVERQLRGEIGACAVIDPISGGVLALASSPGYDPNTFVPSLSPEIYARYATDPAKPLLNRATGGLYAPGSTFKPVTAIAGLEAGWPEHESYDCTGTFALGSMRLRCSSRWGHGELDVRHALMKSCNPFFCNLAVIAGTNAVVVAARAFGLGAKTGIDLGVDAAGVVPDGEWKMRTYREPWYPGDLAQMAIGQGMLLATPLQMARVAGAVGTGWLVTPRLKLDAPVERVPLPFAAAHVAVVRDGMRMVVAGDGESHGTGWRGGEGVPVPVSGKTGTAEIGMGERRRKNTWFVAYAPSERPRIAVAMVIENGESGGGTTAPKVCAVLKAAFREGGS